jgi:nucleotide-binding universal stress UspA family protein
VGGRGSEITGGERGETAKRPASALPAAAGADLVAVGSRGLHGLHAVGSVSERVAHEAPCSTPIAREPVRQRVAAALGR